MSDRRIRALLFILFFLSGTSALIYQIVWVRMFGLVFGVTVFAVSTVLTAFMAGLALGSLYFGRWVDKRSDPLKVFGWLELAIGVFGLSFPFLLNGMNGLYIHVQQVARMGFYSSTLVRFALSFLLLLIPSTLMGGTLPVLSKFFVNRLKRLGWDIGRLYSLNNLGAVIGVFLAGFLLLRVVGVRATINIAAGINLLVGSITLMVARPLAGRMRAGDGQSQEKAQVTGKSAIPEGDTPAYPRYVLYLVLSAFAIEGFTSLSYEVIWSRLLLVLSVYKNVYFFSVIVITFIFGLSFGSFIVAKFIDQRKDLLAIFGFVQIAIGVSAICVLPLFGLLPLLRERVLASYRCSWFTHICFESFAFFLVMVIPTTLMGTTFPVVTKICTMSLNRLGKRIGEIGCLDTVGSIFGAFAAGFVLIPFIGVPGATLLTAAINLLLGAILIFFHPFMRRRAKVLTGLLLACIVAAAFFIVPPSGKLRHWQERGPTDKWLYYEEGPSATVGVVQPHAGVKRLHINGAITAFAEYGDLRVHRLLAYLPYLLHKNPQNALVIGLGMGVTAQSLIHPGMHQVDCVEISPEVVRAAAKCFSAENRNVLQEPKLRLILEDGRYHLLVTDSKYDIITTNAVHARLSPNLYTKDFYEACRDKLADNGIMCQWLPTNWMTESEYWSLVKSFMHSFPHTSLWLMNANHTILIGSSSELQIDFNSFARRLEDPKIKSDLVDVGLDDPFAFLAQYVSDEGTLRKFVANVPLNSDNYPYVEFSNVLDSRVNAAAIGHILAMRGDGSEVLHSVRESSDEFARIKGELAKYRESLESITRAGLSTMYGTTQDALRWFRNGLNVNPDDGFAKYVADRALDDIVDDVQRHLAMGQRAQAITFCESLLEVDPQWPELLVRLAMSYNKIGMFDKATEIARRAIAIAPDFSMAHYALGSVYLRRGSNEHAMAALQQALKLDPDYAPARYRLAAVYARKGMVAEAIAELETVVACEPEFAEGRFSLAMMYVRARKYQEAKRQLTDALRIDSGFQRARSALEELEARH